jgi:acyl-[acyl-carrier-protein]-phospholipid O-acyltransferase / long-chain-fatty-acid--[acyl-carrier-protein] ligase
VTFLDQRHAPLAIEIARPALQRLGQEVLEGYGATETTPVASVNVPDALETETWKVQTGSRPGTVGMPLPGTSFRIVDPVTLETLPPGADGLILIGGVQVMKGYLGAPEKTAEAIVELISLSAVEDAVRHALLLPELELVAVNLPDERKGERIVLLVAASDGLELETLRRAMLASGANPLAIPSEIRRVDVIPRLGSGKTDFGAARRLALTD